MCSSTLVSRIFLNALLSLTVACSQNELSIRLHIEPDFSYGSVNVSNQSWQMFGFEELENGVTLVRGSYRAEVDDPEVAYRLRLYDSNDLLVAVMPSTTAFYESPALQVERAEQAGIQNPGLLEQTFILRASVAKANTIARVQYVCAINCEPVF